MPRSPGPYLVLCALLAISVLCLPQSLKGQTTAPLSAPAPSDLDVSDDALQALSTSELAQVADLLLKLKRNADSLRATRLLLTREPTNQAALLNAGKLSLLEHQPKDAANYAEQVLRTDANNAEAQLTRAEANWQLGDTTKASETLQLVDSEDIERWRSQMPLSVDLKRPEPPSESPADMAKDRFLDEVALAVTTHSLENADQVSADALRRYPDNARCAALRAEYFMRANRPNEALALMQKTAASRSWQNGVFPGQEVLATAFAEIGDRKAARGAWQQILGNAAYPDEQRVQAQQGIKDLDCADLLEAGEKALTANNLDEAAAIAAQLKDTCPDSQEVRAFTARLLLAQGQPEAAVAVLTSLKATVAPGRLFSEQSLLAEGLAAKRDYNASKQAWQSILDSAEASDDLKSTAKAALQDIKADVGGYADAQALYISMDEGSVTRTQGTFRTSQQGKLQWIAGFNRDDINLSDKRFSTPSFASNREQGYVGIEYDFSDKYKLTAFAGGWNDGALGSLFLERSGANKYASLQVTANERALDSLLLESLQGRQHKALAAIELPLTSKLRFEGVAGARIIEAMQTTIGTGFISEAALRWYPFANHPTLSLGYHAEIASFNAEPDSWNTVNKDISRLDRPADYLDINDVLPERFNRHGLQLQWTKQWNEAWRSQLFAEGAYRQETESLEGSLRGSLSHYLSQDLSVSLDAQYDTAGGGPNAGNSVYMTGLGLKYEF